MLHIKLVKSPIANTKRNRATVAALGLRKLHQVVIQPDNPSIRGMVFHVKHMLSVTEVEDTAPVEVAAVAEAEPEAKPAKKPRAKKESEPSESQ